ncbi:MAG: hypothetical protein ACLFQQ_18880 [Desulfococcaceae bacterium]
MSLKSARRGAFDLPGPAVELPISTTIMFRSVADIGRFNGEDLSTVGAKPAWIFSTGSRLPKEPAESVHGNRGPA